MISQTLNTVFTDLGLVNMGITIVQGVAVTTLAIVGIVRFWPARKGSN